MFRYKDPTKIMTPKDNIKNVNVILDGGEDGVSIAELDWNGKKEIGIRWNVSHVEKTIPKKISGLEECSGYPKSFSHSTWFILPHDLLTMSINDYIKNIKNIKNKI